jgi:hypothetical protein
METFTFRNWETMLHTLPGLQTLAISLIRDVQDGESIEVLRRRFADLDENIANMALAALKLDYSPKLVAPLVDNLQMIHTEVSELYQEALDDDYERLVRNICSAQRKLDTFMNGLRQVEKSLNDLGVVQARSLSAVSSTEEYLSASG